jgi:cell wall-associated NlpC family hydrolase
MRGDVARPQMRLAGFAIVLSLGLGLVLTLVAARAATAIASPKPAIIAASTPPSADGGNGPEHITGTKVNSPAAAAWALANVFGTNNGFGDDCTDFVSRALAIGGGDPERLLFDRSTSNDHYWYYSTHKFGRWYSHSWSVAHDLAVHLNLIGSSWIRHWRDARPGDLIFADWKGPSFANISHVGIVTGMLNGQPLITQHTPSQRNITLHYWFKHAGPRVHVWIAVPNGG